ncbi:MAG: KH domain-containing protein [Myxococcota bacterium]
MKECSEAPNLKQVLTTMLHSLVRQPECVEVQELRGSETCVFEVKLHRLTHQDSGRVIGAEGKTLEAMRRVLVSAAGQQGMGCHVKFIGLPSPVPRETKSAVLSSPVRRDSRS